MSSTIRSLAGLAVGLTAGAVCAAWSVAGSEMIQSAAQASGQLWLDALRMTIVPLVFVMIAGGLARDYDLEGAGPRPTRLIASGAALLVLAAVVGLAATLAILAIWPVPERAGGLMAAAFTAGAAPKPPAPKMWFEGLIPTNPIRAAADGAIGPLMVFALAFGLASRRLQEEVRRRLAQGLDAVLQTLLVLVGWVLAIAPIGLAALGFLVGARIGPIAVGPLAHYVAVNCLVSVAALAAIAGVLLVVLGRRTGAFIRAAAPAQLVAFSTQSSLASLPAMIAATRTLGTGASSGEVVLPLAVSLFRVGSAASAISIAVYVAALADVQPSLWSLLAATLLSALISVIAVGLPSQVSYVAILSPICIVVGAPLEILLILMTVDILPDTIRTVANVTGVLGLAVARPGSDGEAPAQVDGGEAVPAA